MTTRAPAEAEEGTRPAPPPFEPAPPPTTYTPPAAHPDPDPSKGWVRRIIPILRPFRAILVGTVAASVTMLGVQVAIPQVLRGAIDHALVSRTATLGPYIVAMLALGVTQTALGYVQRFGVQRASIEIETLLRTLVFTHLGRLSFSFYDQVHSGQLISRGNSDIRAIQMFLVMSPMISTAMLSFAAALILMIQMHPLLTLVSCTTLPLVFVTGLSMRKRLGPIQWITSSRQADLATVVEENVTGTRIVKSFGAEKRQLSLFEQTARRLRWSSLLAVDNQAKYGPVMMSLPRLSQALILLYGGWLVIRGTLSLGTFVAFNSYVLMLQAPFLMIGMMMMQAQRARASAIRVLEILDREPDVVDRPGAVDLVTGDGLVELRDVTFGYRDDAPVLRGLTFRLDPGDTVALVGRTGCGKSTVARLLPRFYDVTSGEVRIDGLDVRDITLRSLRAQVAMVLDEPFLFSDTIGRNIAFGRPDASAEEIEEAAGQAGADDFIRRLPDGYDTVIGERGYTLSGGQRQRLAIARTLLMNPRILVLDDATSSVDPQREHEIHAALRTLMQGRTTLVIAHRLSTISLADRIAVMDDGRIVAEGTHDELLRTLPLYAEILARADDEAPAPKQATPPFPMMIPNIAPAVVTDFAGGV